MERPDARAGEGFAPICPDFVVELRLPGDGLKDLQEKMGHWIAVGAKLAWLLDPERRTVEVYRPGKAQADALESVSAVYGEGPVAGFVLELAHIWR